MCLWNVTDKIGKTIDVSVKTLFLTISLLNYFVNGNTFIIQWGFLQWLFSGSISFMEFWHENSASYIEVNGKAGAPFC